MNALTQEITTLRARVEEAQKATERALTAVVPPFPVPAAANPQAPASVADVLAKQTAFRPTPAPEGYEAVHDPRHATGAVADAGR